MVPLPVILVFVVVGGCGLSAACRRGSGLWLAAWCVTLSVVALGFAPSPTGEDLLALVELGTISSLPSTPPFLSTSPPPIERLGLGTEE
jgi:hypothetical protein